MNVRMCPKCHSDNIQYQTVTEQKKSGCLIVMLYILLCLTCIGILIVIPLMLRKKDQVVTYAVCQSCDYRWKV